MVWGKKLGLFFVFLSLDAAEKAKSEGKNSHYCEGRQLTKKACLIFRDSLGCGYYCPASTGGKRLRRFTPSSS